MKNPEEGSEMQKYHILARATVGIFHHSARNYLNETIMDIDVGAPGNEFSGNLTLLKNTNVDDKYISDIKSRFLENMNFHVGLSLISEVMKKISGFNEKM